MPLVTDLSTAQLAFQILGSDVDQFSVIRYRGTEGLCQLYRFEIELERTYGVADLNEIIGNAAVTLELEPNRASLHSAALYHGSEQNRSNDRRCGYIMRFISTRTRFNHERGYYHQIYLARGHDHAGNRYGDPTVARPDLMEARKGRIRKGH